MPDAPGSERPPAATTGMEEQAVPRLPDRAPTAAPTAAAPRPAGPRTYRPESEREALVHRRANPWWHRMLRLIVLAVILGGLLTGGYFAVDALADYLGRDRLPAPGVDSAAVLSASYHVWSGPDVGGLVGDITVDHVSGTFRFLGAAETDLAGLEIVGDAASHLAVRRDGGAWELGWTDARADRLIALRTYLDVVDTDDVLTTTWRDGYVSIDDREEGVAIGGLDDTTMYTIEFDAARYATDHPFQWNEWVATVLPLPAAIDDTLLSVWVDGDGVIRGFDNAAAALRWERVTYSGDTVPIEFPLS
jgi:hypothetical protein